MEKIRNNTVIKSAKEMCNMGKITTKLEYIPTTNIKKEYSTVHLDGKIIGIINNEIKPVNNKLLNFLPLGKFNFISDNKGEKVVGMIVKHIDYVKLPDTPVYFRDINNIEWDI